MELELKAMELAEKNMKAELIRKKLNLKIKNIILFQKKLK
jgi:hypothetical protein